MKKKEYNFLDKNIEIFESDDGSIALYNKEIDEIYHSRYGAKKEAFEKFIEPVLKIQTFNKKKLKILDICYGIGYNTKCALENFYDIELIDCVEIDKNLAINSYRFEYDDKINKIIENNIKKEEFIHFYFEDARKFILNLDKNKKYDLILHDGFSPLKQALLWSEDFIFEVSKHLENSGLYLTYNHSKPVLNALKYAKLFIGRNTIDKNTTSIIASFDENLILNKLNDFELKQLNTKSAITYKDKNLNLTHDEIISNRENEILTSKKETLSHFLKYNKSLK